MERATTDPGAVIDEAPAARRTAMEALDCVDLDVVRELAKHADRITPPDVRRG